MYNPEKVTLYDLGLAPTGSPEGLVICGAKTRRIVLVIPWEVVDSIRRNVMQGLCDENEELRDTLYDLRERME